EALPAPEQADRAAEAAEPRRVFPAEPVDLLEIEAAPVADQVAVGAAKFALLRTEADLERDLSRAVERTPPHLGDVEARAPVPVTAPPSPDRLGQPFELRHVGGIRVERDPVEGALNAVDSVEAFEEDRRVHCPRRPLLRIAEQTADHDLGAAVGALD